MFKRILLFAALAGVTSISCSENIPDCPSRMCVVAGGWRLTSALIDDEVYIGDPTQYRLILTMPESNSQSTSGFSRIQQNGAADAGSWSLVNNESVLRLVPESGQPFTEDWIIESMTPRRLVLIINRDVTIKQGPARIKLFLEPF